MSVLSGFVAGLLVCGRVVDDGLLSNAGSDRELLLRVCLTSFAESGRFPAPGSGLEGELLMMVGVDSCWESLAASSWLSCSLVCSFDCSFAASLLACGPMKRNQTMKIIPRMTAMERNLRSGPALDRR